MPGTAYVSGSGAAGAAPAGPPRDRCTLHGGEPGFCLRDALRDFFRTAAEVHALQLIPLRRQVVNLAFALIEPRLQEAV